LKEYLCWFVQEKFNVFYEIMIKMIVGSTSSSSNMQGAVDNNYNRYKSMIMDAMRMNQCYAGKCSIVDEKLNINVTRFLKLLKDSDEPYGMGA